MDTINDVIKFMLIIIPIGAVARIGYCLTAMAVNQDDCDSYKGRIRNALIFCIASECIVGLVNLFKSYF
jgi:hypothetical protein